MNPQSSLAGACRQAHEPTQLPVLVTDHDADLHGSQDHRRGRFIEASLRDQVSAIADDMDVRGYLHCSLTGNDEWLNGYQGHCGLLGADRAAQRRSARPSAAVPGGVTWANGIA